MFYLASIFSQNEDKNINKQAILEDDRCHELQEVHLKTSLQFFGADKQCKVVDALVDNNSETSKEVCDAISGKYPIFLIRYINVAKKWTRDQVRGSRRYGVPSCSNARRLKPEDFYAPMDMGIKS